MNKQLLALGLIFILMIMMGYAVFVEIKNDKELIQAFQDAAESCEVENFEGLCDQCRYGIGWWDLK